MKAAIYARYSSDNQRPESIDDQVNSCRRFALSNDISIEPEHVYFDEAVSGSRSNRKGLNELILAAEANQFEAVLVDDLSRFSRSMLHLLTALSKFEYLGIRLISVTESIDTSQEDSGIIAKFKGIINEMYLVDLKKKTMRGLIGQLDRGFFLSEAPYGFNLVASGEIKIDRKGRARPAGYMIEINVEELIVVKRIFETFAAGKSLTSIMKELNIENIKSPGKKTEKGWGPSTIHRIIKNEKYIGIWVWGKNQTKRDTLTGTTKLIPRNGGPLRQKYFEDLAVISKDVWDTVQKRLEETKNTWPTGKGKKGFQAQQGSRVKVYPQQLLSGAMVCDVCGGAICLISGKGGGYYGCLKARNKEACSNKLIVQRKKVEQKVLGKVSDILNNSDNIQYIMRKVEELSAKMFTTAPEDIRTKKLALKENERAAENFVEFISMGNMSKMIADALAVSEKKIASLKSELQALEQTMHQIFKQPPKEWIEDRIEHIQETLELQTEQSALLLRKLVGTIRMEPITPDIGKPYLVANSKLQPLVLFDEKRPQKGPLSFEPDNGSNALQWWTTTELKQNVLS